MDEPGLLSLTDELLLQVLLAAGAPSVARAAAACRRLRSAKAQLAALPAFAAAACTTHVELESSVTEAVKAAREQMPAGVDFCIVFVAGSLRGRARDAERLDRVVPWCQALLPPGTAVVGCCGRGLHGVERGRAVEFDPSAARGVAVSVLLGRMPGCRVRAFSAAQPPPGGWTSAESCGAWLGVQDAPGSGAEGAPVVAGGAEGAPVVAGGPSSSASAAPLSLLLFAHPSTGNDLLDCLDGLHSAFPRLVVTGGISSGMAHLFSSHPLPPSAERPPASPRSPSRRPPFMQYAGLVVAEPGGGGSAGQGAYRGAALTAQGMQGAPPLLTQLHLIRHFGTLQHPTGDGDLHEVELVGLAGACNALGQDASRALGELAESQAELGCWAATAADAEEGFDAAAAAGRPVVVLQCYGTVHGEESLAAASDDAALEAVLEAAAAPGHMLCAQPLELLPEGARAALATGVERLVGGQPGPHPLLPTATAGLVLVSCTAKGKQMYKEEGVEARLVHDVSGQLPFAGVYCDGEIGAPVPTSKAAVQFCSLRLRRATSVSKLMGFTTIATMLAAAHS